MKPPLYPYLGHLPQVSPTAFVAPTAAVIGDVKIGADSSIWFGAVLRGDVQAIAVGERTSIQDNSVVHATTGLVPVHIGNDVTVGHAVILHGCTISDRVLVGMGSIVLDEAVLEADVMLGAGSLVTARTRIPSGTLAHGRPAKPVRDLTKAELESIREAATHYAMKCAEYRRT